MDPKLCIAAESGNIDVLVQNKEKLVVELTPHQNTVLHIASQLGRTKCVSKILSMHPLLLHHVNSRGESALHLAARNGKKDVVMSSPACTLKLLDWKSSLVKKTDEKGLSPLHYAALSGFSFGTSQLLDVDNSVAYLSDNDNNTALHIAVSGGHYSIVKILMSHSPHCWEITNDKRQNILHIALEHKRKAIVKYILQNSRAISTLITQKDIDGNTPLHFLAASECYMPPKLIRHPMADKKALNKEKLTPLDMIPERYKNSATRFYQRKLRHVGGTLSLRKRISIIKHMRKETTANEDQAIVADKQKETLNNIRKGVDTSMIVAALIVTVTFTAGFTMPGGYNQSGAENLVPGMSVLSKRRAFQAFVISDAIALLFSSTAIFLNFWATWNRSLKIVRNLAITATWFVIAAIVAMMVAFSTTTYVVLEQSSTLAAACFVCILSIPLSLLSGLKLIGMAYK